MVREFAQRMMDADVEVACNAGYGEVTPDRVNSRNGYRRREWDTRAGTEPVAFRRGVAEVQAGRVTGRLDGRVAKPFLWAERDQPFLLPVDMRDGFLMITWCGSCWRSSITWCSGSTGCETRRVPGMVSAIRGGIALPCAARCGLAAGVD
jgi:hypothetical protein